MECVNLRKQFGSDYKIEYEESYYAEHGPDARVEDPWLMIIPCLHGHICPWGDGDLAACTDKNGRVANQLRKHPLVTVAQDGDGGVNALFDVKHFDVIAKIMKPRKRRKLSEAQKQKNIERLRVFWPAKGETVAGQRGESGQGGEGRVVEDSEGREGAGERLRVV